MPIMLRLTVDVVSPETTYLLQMPHLVLPPSQGEGSMVFAYGHAVMAAVLARIAAVDAGAADALHGPGEHTRGWALSPLCHGTDGWFLEIGFPNDALADIAWRALRAGWAAWTAHHPTTPAQLQVTGAARRAAERWEALTTPSPCTKWRLTFLTPTAMAMPGGRSKVQLPLPLPSALLESWRRVWNQHCPTGYHISEAVGAIVADQLAVSSFTGETAKIDVPVNGYSKPFVGFTGQATLALLDAHRLPPEVVTACQALFRFAPYCGTGKKTAWGLGMVRMTEVRSHIRRPNKSAMC